VTTEGSVEAVVFDLFGTLVPEFTRDDFHGSVRAMARAVGADEERFLEGWLATAPERQTGVHPTIEANVRAICERLDVPVREQDLRRALALRDDVYERSFHPRPGAIETLSVLRERRMPVALVSMCAPDTPALWRASELAALVDVEVFSAEVGLRKPDPAIYRLATEGLGVVPQGCLYVGDGAYGELTGAEAVGMRAVLIRPPDVDPAVMLTPERDDGWSGPVIEELREVLQLVG
jgi:putative hydrolase of the HAD superfamily